MTLFDVEARILLTMSLFLRLPMLDRWLISSYVMYGQVYVLLQLCIRY